MLTYEKPTITVRLTPEELESLNKFSENYENQSGVKVDNLKQLLFSMISKGSNFSKTEESQEETREVVYVDELKPELKEYADEHDLAFGFVALDIIKHSLTNKTEIEVEKEIEIERPLRENQILIEVDEAQKDCLTTINTNRNEKLRAMDADPENIGKTIVGMLFNEANLNNWSGSFYTGWGE